MQIHNDGGCGKYLGLPEQFGRKKVELFQYIVEKVSARTKGWSHKFLSQGGKEILLKSIAIAMPVYTMNCFKLPKGICEDIERVIANYWWNTHPDRNSIHWLSWNRMKYSKKEGGLGFRDIEKFNDALLAKQAWRILQYPDCLMAKTLRGRYFSQSNVLNASRGYIASFGWQSILHGRNLLRTGLRYIVGDGSMIQTWLDPWLPVHPPRAPRARVQPSTNHHYVHDFFLPNKSGWNEGLIREQVHEDDVYLILTQKLSQSQNKDYLGWHYTEDGKYNVKSGYWLGTHLPNLDQAIPPPRDPQIKSQIWNLNTPPKMKHFLWRMLSRALAMSTALERRRVVTDSYCRRCVTAHETTDHLFFTCSHARQIWRASNIPLPCLSNPQVPYETKIKEIFEFHKMQGKTHYKGKCLFQSFGEFGEVAINWCFKDNKMVGGEISEMLHMMRKNGLRTV